MKVRLLLLISSSFVISCTGSMLDELQRKPGNVYHGRYTRDVESPEFLVPRRVFHDGSFRSYVLPEFYDRREVVGRQKRSSSEEDRDRQRGDELHLVLPFNGMDHHVELQPHHEFISPKAVVETRSAPLDGANLNDAVAFRSLPDRQCHYRGVVRGHDNSRAALSLCDGVAGYVQTNQGRYFIEPISEAEPAADGQHVHMAYKRSAPHERTEGRERRSHCATDDNWEAAWAEQLAKRQQLLENNPNALKRKEPSSGTHSIHRYIEVALIVDRRFLDYHNGTNYESYLLTIMNMASDFYHDGSTGNQIDVVIVRVIYLELQKDEIDLHISPAAEKTLDSFAAWSNKMNPKDHDHPNHHDIAVLVTRYDICASDSGCDLLGLAYVAAACDPEKAACINEDAGLVLGIVITHEVGHVMGCSHDTVEISGCEPEDKDGSQFIMSPYVGMFTLRWSACSRKFITSYLESGLGDCLNDDPRNPPEKYKYPGMLPGAMYDAEYQCDMGFPGSKLCDLGQGDFCKQLWCRMGGSCKSKGDPPAEGTKCGENKWCIHQECVEAGSRPAAVNGGWGEWNPAGECSRTCGGGVKTSERECNKPAPANGGRYCIGERKKYSTCNTTPCDPNKPSFRAVQCAEYNNQTVLSDGLHTWSPYLMSDKDVCALYCINERNTYVKLSPTAKDATPCKGGTNHMCLAGACRKVGCDWVIDSDAIEDQCGICKGDGTQCSPVEGTFKNKGKMSYNKVVTIPKGSRSITISEKDESMNCLALKPEKGDKYCLNADFREERNGEYECVGALAIYSHPLPQKEEIEIKGPIKEDLQVQYVFFKADENPGIHYKYYVKSTNSTYTPKYIWEFVDWSSCSAKCGGGTMISEASCVEQQAGKVTPNFCKSIPKPEPKSRICNEKTCQPKWRVSQWSKCNACDGKKGIRRRKVQCVKPAAHPGGDDVQANLNACKGRVPKQQEECVGTRPCRKKCPKKTRESKTEDVKDLENSRGLTIEEQRQMLDKVVDLGIARYLEKSFGGSVLKSEKRDVADDFRQLLREWVRNTEDKRKRSTQCPEGKKFTTPKPGTIVKDTIRPDRARLYVAPIRDEFFVSNMSDRGFQEEGDVAPVAIDTKQEKIYKGAEAIKLIGEMVNHNSTGGGDNTSSTGKQCSTTPVTETET